MTCVFVIFFYSYLCQIVNYLWPRCGVLLHRASGLRHAPAMHERQQMHLCGSAEDSPRPVTQSAKALPQFDYYARQLAKFISQVQARPTAFII